MGACQCNYGDFKNLHWLFIVATHRDDGKTISSEEIYQYRMDDEF